MAVFNEPTQWSHELGNNADVSTLPDDTSATTGVASLQKLFQVINQTPLEAGGVAPEREDFNALFKYLGDQIFYTQNGGVPSYNADYDYIAGRVVLYNGNIYKCIQTNGVSSTVVAPDSDDTYWQQLDKPSSALLPNQLIISPVPMTEANLHLLDGALLSGSGAYADYVTMMSELYNADPTATCWTDEATWQASVTTYGECGKFVYDSVNNTLRLPKLTSFVQATSTASELGSLVEAGLPNITGTTGNEAGYRDSAQSIFSGALYRSGTTFKAIVDNTGGNTYSCIGLDASRSNSIYGNSNTVQPQAIKYYFYIVVGTVSKLAIQVDIDQIATDLNGKADTDLSNVPNSKGILVESYVNGTSWYRVYSDGWCEQGGELVGVSDYTVSFLKQFANTNYLITVGGYDYTSPDDAKYCAIQWRNKTIAGVRFQSAWDGTLYATTIDWRACGYIS